MTKRQIKAALKKAGISLDAVEISGSNEVEAPAEIAEQVLEALGQGWGGYRTGYGAWVYSYSYQISTIDYNDTSSPLHY